MASKDEISTKGLDSLNHAFLTGSKNAEVTVREGQSAKPEALQRYDEARKKDFIKRAGSFTEDLVAFIAQQRRARDLTDTESIFAIALANINLRDAFGMAQAGEKQLTEADREQLLQQFDAICYAAQEYYDANT